eukprot:2804573-Lingulodinium_polyedra.AAC.1
MGDRQDGVTSAWRSVVWAHVGTHSPRPSTHCTCKLRTTYRAMPIARSRPKRGSQTRNENARARSGAAANAPRACPARLGNYYPRMGAQQEG